MHWGSILAALTTLVACTGSTESPIDSAPPAPTTCEDGVAVLPFSDEETGVQFGERAADFTATTLDGGTFRLSEAWNGCDSFVVISYFEGASDALWSSSPENLFKNAPKNSQFIFVSDEMGPARRESRLQAMRDALDLGPARADRAHFLVDRLSSIEGGLGDFVTDYVAYLPESFVQIDADRGSSAPVPSFLGIDRFQTWDPGGNTNDIVGGTPQVEIAGYLPLFYNHKAQLATRLASEDVTEIELLNEEVTERVFDRTVDLPADLSGFDTLEFDVEVTCKERNPFACSEWDRIARIDWCTDATCEERQEIVRWITPYWRRGNRRWAIDASAFLGLVPGGTQTFRISMGPGLERATPRDARVTARLSTRGVPRPASTVQVFSGGTFNADYNANHPPVTLDVPAGATKVELVTILSGHGQDGTTNCSEWCDHRHRFSIDGQEAVLLQSDEGIGSRAGCAPAAAQGVPPGQWGNWAPQRAYWCPGLPVDPVANDLTSLVTPGSTAELGYEAFLQGTFGPEGAGGGNISLS
ncbi:MAG: peptide-N-glycosidase F-related protein, partial [Myxococcota bacterium]